MKFLSSLKAERCISQVLETQDLRSPEGRKAVENLRGLGDAAVPRVIEALSAADASQARTFIEFLATQASDKTFKDFAAGLSYPDKRVAAAVAQALAISPGFDANLLLDLLGNDEIFKPALLDLLTRVGNRLNARELLRRAYDLDPRDKAAAFKVIRSIAGPDLIPELIARVDGKDMAVRIHIIETLSRFDRPEVAEALERQLGDRSQAVRKAALEALSAMPGDRDIQRICALLADPDLEVQSQAVELVIKLRHPDTLKYLVEVLKDESEFARRAAVEVLNEIADASTLKHLLTALGDDDWWVRTRASDAIAKIGGPRVMDAVLQLVGDKNEDIRRAAIEILNQTKDERAVSHLIGATRDQDWWVRERAADALAEIGDPKAAPALLAMIEGDPRSVPAAVRALGRVGDSRVLDQLLPLLDRPEKEIRVEALNAVTRLTDPGSLERVRGRLQRLATGADETMARLATAAMSRIEAVASPTGLGATGLAGTGPLRARAEAPATAATLLADNAQLDAAASQLALPSNFDIASLKRGDLIEGRYRFIEKIGKGAFGTVVLVEDTVVEERLILKFLNPNMSSDEEMLKRFVHELRFSRKITHRNVIRIYDFIRVEGHYAISMEYFPSHPLSAELSARKPLPFDKAISWAKDIATGMAVAHQVGIVHRDLKPANILINDDGLLKIVDFGVAAAATAGDTQLTKTGYVIGSPKYMAPEQILGKKVDERADVYSLGVILYEMLTGTPPYTKGDHMSVMYQHVQGKAKRCDELNPEIGPALAEVVRKSMEVDKFKRYGSMEELREALAKAS